jgi:hypothetical protein
MVATPHPERVPRDAVRCEFAFSSWPEALELDKDSGLAATGDDAGGVSGSSRSADGGRVGVVGVCAACVCELKSTQT